MTRLRRFMNIDRASEWFALTILVLAAVSTAWQLVEGVW